MADPVGSGGEEGLSSDSVDDLIKSSSCSEGRASSDGLLSSNDQIGDSREPIRSQKTDERRAQKNNLHKGPIFPAKVVDDDDIKPLLGADGGVLLNRREESRASLGDIDIIELLGSSDSSEKETSPTPSADVALAHFAVQDVTNEDDMEPQSGRKESVQKRISLSDNVVDMEKQQNGRSERKESSDVDILELITSDDDQEEEVAAPIIHLTAVEKSQTLPEVQELIATDDEDYVAVMATAKDAAKKDEPEKTEQPPKLRIRYRPGPASSKRGMPSVVYDLSSDDEGKTVSHPDDEGNEADVEEDDVVDVSDNEDGNSYLDHRGSSSEDYDSDNNSYLEHRGDSSGDSNDGCEENCENSVVIEEEEEAVCIVGEIRNETIEEEEEDVENDNNDELLVQIDDSERDKVKNNNVVVETIDDDDDEGNVPSSSPAPFVISEVRTGIGTEAENDWDDILVEEIDARQSSVEPESTPRSRFNHHHLPSSSSVCNDQPSSSGGPEVVRLSPPREMVEPEITLLPIASRPEPTAQTSTRTEATPRPGLKSSTRPVFQSTFAGIAPRPPTASSSRQLLLEPPEQQVLSTRSRRSLGGQQSNVGLNQQVLSTREGPRSEWDTVDTSEGRNNRRRQEWDTNLRLNTVVDSSSAPASKKKRKRQRGKKKQKTLAEKQIVNDADNDDEVEALN